MKKEYWNVKVVYGNVMMTFDNQKDALNYADMMVKTLRDYVIGSPTADYLRVIKQL